MGLHCYFFTSTEGVVDLSTGLKFAPCCHTNLHKDGAFFKRWSVLSPDNKSQCKNVWEFTLWHFPLSLGLWWAFTFCKARRTNRNVVHRWKWMWIVAIEVGGHNFQQFRQVKEEKESLNRLGFLNYFISVALCSPVCFPIFEPLGNILPNRHKPLWVEQKGH